LSFDEKLRETRAAISGQSMDNEYPQSKEMDMSIDEIVVRRGGGSAARRLQPRKWRSSHTLQSVQQMNEHCLNVLVTLAMSEPGKPALDLVTRYRDLWRQLDREAIGRAARNPVLLVDVHFLDETWWRWAMNHGTRTDSGKGSGAGDGFPPKIAGELMRATLMLAWSAAREDRHAAGLLFGMSGAVASFVAALTPQHIERIASRHSRELRLRWEDAPAYWQSLLIAARENDIAALREAHLYSLQLMASEMFASRGRDR